MYNKSRITNTEVIPRFKSDLFTDHEQAQFAVGLLAEGGNSLYSEEIRAYHQLRAEVYARQTHMLPLDRVQPDGGEYDANDPRSIHLAILENGGEFQRVVASMRLILRGGKPLPIEGFFLDVFADNPAPETSCEVSRYITRHEDLSVQENLRWPLFQKALAETMSRNLDPAFAVVEPYLARILRLKRIPVQELAKPVWVEEYNTYNVPIVIDIERLAERMERLSPGALAAMMAAQGDFVYFAERQEQSEARSPEVAEQIESIV
jgi:N-acyl-L-homoserine lactone synthetase